MEYYLDCSGWSYDGWKGPFYPKDLDNRYWLSYYSQLFDFVEIDSTFYKIPSKFMANNWNKRTPETESADIQERPCAKQTGIRE